MQTDPISYVPATDEATGLTNVIIDTPRGSACKFKFDPATGLYRLSKILPEGMRFPYDFGAIPSTLAEDGDALDVMVLNEVASFTGCLARVKLVGAIEAEQTEHGKTVRNDRLLGVIVTSYNQPIYTSLAEVPEPVLAGIEHFFVSYNEAQGRVFRPLARSGPAQAAALVAQARERFGSA